MDNVMELYNLIIKLLHDKEKENEIRALFNNYHPYDAAEAFKLLTDQERQSLYDILDEETLASIFSYLDELVASDYIQELSFKQAAEVLNEMETDDAADIINEINEDSDASVFLNQLEDNVASSLIALSNHEEDTAGAIMSTNFIKIPSNSDVKKAMKILGEAASEYEVIDPLFVCDGDTLLGVLSLQDLIIARSPSSVNDIMDDNYIFASVDDDTIDVAKKITNYDIYALPILDNGKIVGIVTMDDAIDIASDSITDDYSKMATVTAEEIEESSMFKTIIKRIPWLLLLLVVSLLVSNITSSFEEVISKITILWFFNTMILDMAGNIGTQCLAVSVRKLGRNELSTFKWTVSHVVKEMLTNALISIAIGALSFLITLSFIFILKYNNSVNPYYASFVIALSLVITLNIAGFLGVIIPIILEKIHIDPAFASGPVISTLNDIVAILVYFGLATIFMNKILM